MILLNIAGLCSSSYIVFKVNDDKELYGSYELKTKPTQHSVIELRGMGIQPDIIVTRSPIPLEASQKEKISDILSGGINSSLHKKVEYLRQIIGDNFNEFNSDDTIIYIDGKNMSFDKSISVIFDNSEKACFKFPSKLFHIILTVFSSPV